MATINNRIILNDVRLDRVSLSKPYQGQPDRVTGKLADPKWHVDCIFGEDHPQFAQITQLIIEAVNKKFVTDPGLALEQIKANNRLPIHRGNLDRAGKPQYANKLFISANANSADPPNVVATENGVNIATQGTPIVLTPANPKFPYAGCYANVALEFFGYDSNGSKGVSAKVLAVQFLRHGEPLRGSSVVAATEFGIVATDADGPAPAAAPKTSLL